MRHCRRTVRRRPGHGCVKLLLCICIIYSSLPSSSHSPPLPSSLSACLLPLFFLFPATPLPLFPSPPPLRPHTISRYFSLSSDFPKIALCVKPYDMFAGSISVCEIY